MSGNILKSLPPETAQLMPWKFEPLEPRWWFSYTRMRASLNASMVAPTLTLASCYCGWLVYECDPFVPFISDLGVHEAMRACFATGLTLSTIPLTCSLLDIFEIRRHVLQAHNSSLFWKGLNVIHASYGVFLIVGLGLLGYFPWDTRLYPHLLCAQAILIGGPIWCIIHVALASYLRFSLGCGIGWTLTRVLTVLLVCVNLLAVPEIVIHAVKADKEVSIAKTMKYVHTDFAKYCSADGERMASHQLNMAALWEWLNIATMLGILMTAYVDLDIYSVLLKHTMAGELEEKSGRKMELLQQYGLNSAP